jgi:hypothetical protein
MPDRKPTAFVEDTTVRADAIIPYVSPGATDKQRKITRDNLAVDLVGRRVKVDPGTGRLLVFLDGQWVEPVVGPSLPIPVAQGGTGATTQAAARTSLGIGTLGQQNADAVAITGGTITGITDLAVADGGTGASTARLARSNLRLIDTSLAAEILRTAAGDWSAADLSGRTIANRGVMGSTWNAYLGTSAVTPGSADPTVSVFSGSRAVRLPGTVGNYASCPSGAHLGVAGDLELGWTGDFPFGANSVATGPLIARDDLSVRNYALRLAIGSRRPVFHTVASDGVTVLFVTGTADVPSTATGLKVMHDVNNGAAGNTVTFEWSADFGASWQALGAPVVGAGVFVRSTASSSVSLGFSPSVGYVGPHQTNRAWIKSAGTTVADFDARLCGQNGYTDPYGNTWTVNRSTTGLKTMLVDEDPPLLFGTDDYLTVPAKLFVGPWTNLAVRTAWNRPTSFGYTVRGFQGSSTDGALIYGSSATDIWRAGIGTGAAQVLAPSVTMSYGTPQLIGGVYDGAAVATAIGATLSGTTAGVMVPQIASTTYLGLNDDAEYHRWLHWPRALTAYELGRVAQHLGVA